MNIRHQQNETSFIYHYISYIVITICCMMQWIIFMLYDDNTISMFYCRIECSIHVLLYDRMFYPCSTVWYQLVFLISDWLSCVSWGSCLWTIQWRSVLLQITGTYHYRSQERTITDHRNVPLQNVPLQNVPLQNAFNCRLTASISHACNKYIYCTTREISSANMGF